MWQRFLCTISCLILLAGCSSVETISSHSPVLCSVIPFESRSGMKTGEAESVTEIFSSSLHKSGRFTVVERKQMNAVLQEQGFQATQSGEDAVQAGKILAVRKMFLGSIGMLGNNYLVTVKMIDVETSKMEYAHTWTFDDNLEYIGEDLFPKVMKELITHLDTAVQK